MSPSSWSCSMNSSQTMVQASRLSLSVKVVMIFQDQQRWYAMMTILMMLTDRTT